MKPEPTGEDVAFIVRGANLVANRKNGMKYVVLDGIVHMTESHVI
jgi:hypothetical protein